MFLPRNKYNRKRSRYDRKLARKAYNSSKGKPKLGNLGYYLYDRMRRANLRSYKSHIKHGTMRMLPSGFSDTQTWGGLEKAWVGFIISDQEGNLELKQHYAAIIQKLQNELGLELTSFYDLNMIALGYYEDNAKYLSDEVTGDELIHFMIDHDKSIFRQLKEERNEL